jgi:hypothetical protein
MGRLSNWRAHRRRPDNEFKGGRAPRAVPRSGSPLRFCVASEIPICLRERRIVVAREEGAARVVAHRKGVVPALINPAAFEEETSGRARAASGKHGVECDS